MIKRFSLLLFSASLLFCEKTLGLRKLGSFRAHIPGYCSLYENRKPNSSDVTYDLLIAPYVQIPGLYDGAYIVTDVGRSLGKISEIKPHQLTKGYNGPKEISGIPEFIFGKRMIALPEGIQNDVITSKTKGDIRLVDLSVAQGHNNYVITGGDDNGWMYHRVEWLDMDGDADKDIITCRVQETSAGFVGELIWLENPAGNYKKIWKSHVLAQSPDIFFRYAFIPTPEGPLECIVVAGFYSTKLSVLWPKDKKIMWSDQSNIAERIVDTTIGHVYDVSVLDINGDGRRDLLVTNNDELNGTVFAYEVPLDFRNGTFVRHVLASGFKPRHTVVPGFVGAPGAAKPLCMPTKYVKPILFLSGDANGRAYYLLAKTQSPSDWSYLLVPFADDNLSRGSEISAHRIGEMAIADVDNDGYDEIFIPSYFASKVDVFTANP